MNRNVNVIEEKMDLVMNFYFYFYFKGENVAKRNSKPMQFSFLQIC
jgi:hypothetical protein